MAKNNSQRKCHINNCNKTDNLKKVKFRQQKVYMCTEHQRLADK